MNRTEFLQRLIGIAGYGSFKVQALVPKRKIYLLQFFVAGFRFHKGMELLNHMQVNDLLELRREPDNEHDDCAIALYWQQEKIGYIPAEENEMLAKLLDAQALPLLGMITHLNREVKPWENVVAAVYFLQDESVEIPPYAAYLKQVAQPIYSSSQKSEKDKLYEELFDYSNRIVDLSAIPIPAIKKHFDHFFAHNPKYAVMYQGRRYTHIPTDDIYTYMYNVNPVQWITADNGEEYLLFEFVESQ
ncbi:MAG TPA: HIRAN domain-containing protein [Ferruginibacter sp.]|nr:HIRAN domain-containing protein [Ferruginibacter sp.]HMP21561.1 HIRAN domain-containing protein [Ferruginibacter sp.]